MARANKLGSTFHALPQAGARYCPHFQPDRSVQFRAREGRRGRAPCRSETTFLCIVTQL